MADIEKRIDALMDRLYLLKDVRQRVDRKIAAKEQELQSLGGRTATALDTDLESRQTVLAILQKDIDRVLADPELHGGMGAGTRGTHERA